MALVVGDNRVVSIHFKLTDDEGNVRDSTEGAEPLSYLHGVGNVMPGLEKALEGKVEGDSLQVRVDPVEGYGAAIPELIQTVDRSVFQGVETVEPGMVFEGQAPDGSMQRLQVIKVEGDKITIDANHPLAGAVLHFDVEIVAVREATEEEVAKGTTN